MARWRRPTPADIREVHSLIERTETRIMAELKRLEAQIDSQDAQSTADAVAWRAEHQRQHAQERTKRWQVAAWMATTLITAAGVLTAIVAALR